MRTYIYKGCIYPDFSSRGKRRKSGSAGYKFVRGVGFVSFRRWVAEMTYCGKRYRCRSTDRRAVERWLSDMCNKFNDNQDNERKYNQELQR